METTVPFNLFGKEEKLQFDIKKALELEAVLGKPIQQIARVESAGLTFCLAALPIGLKRLNPHIYMKKIEEYLNVEGNTIDDIAIPIIYALALSGVLGGTVKNNVKRILYPELYPDTKETETEETEGKNE